jgi:hypothetical protein
MAEASVIDIRPEHAHTPRIWPDIIRGDEIAAAGKLVVQAVRLWYAFTNSSTIASYGNLCTLMTALTTAHSEEVRSSLALGEHGLLAKFNQFRDASPFQWSAHACMALLQSGELLCRFYNGHHRRLNAVRDQLHTINLGEGRKSALVEGLVQYVTGLLSIPVPPDCFVGKCLADRAKVYSSGFRIGAVDLIPDRHNLQVVQNSGYVNESVMNLPTHRFIFTRTLAAWELSIADFDGQGNPWRTLFDIRNVQSSNLVERLFASAIGRCNRTKNYGWRPSAKLTMLSWQHLTSIQTMVTRFSFNTALSETFAGDYVVLGCKRIILQQSFNLLCSMDV